MCDQEEAVALGLTKPILFKNIVHRRTTSLKSQHSFPITQRVHISRSKMLFRYVIVQDTGPPSLISHKVNVNSSRKCRQVQVWN